MATDGPLQAVGFQVRAFLTAVQFLTRVPVPESWVEDGGGAAARLVQAPVYFPLVGSLIGLFTAAAIASAAHFWPTWVAVTLGLAAEALLTGAFHEDAVADFCDAFGGGWTRDEILEILEDSRVGSFGTVGLTLALLLRAGGTAALEPPLLVSVTVASATLGRWAILPVMALLPPVAGRDGLARDVGRQLTPWQVLWAGILALPGAAPFACQDPVRAAAALALLGGLVVGFTHYVRRRLGGVTGDCLGCVCYAGQILVVLTATAGVSVG